MITMFFILIIILCVYSQYIDRFMKSDIFHFAYYHHRTWSINLYQLSVVKETPPLLMHFLLFRQTILSLADKAANTIH